MDQRYRFSDDTELHETIADAVQAKIHTALPVTPSKDADGHTIELQPTIKSTQLMPDGSTQLVTLPVLSDVPVLHSGGGGIYTTHAHKTGDEGVVILTGRSHDEWFQEGGVQQQADARMHSLSDGFYLPGAHSTPRKLKGVSKNSTQTRTDDKKSVHDVSQTAITTVREDAAHQVNGMAIQSQKGGSRHTVDGSTIQNTAGKILLNC